MPSAKTFASMAERTPKGFLFSVKLPALPRGHYFARASLYKNGRRVTRSDKRHFVLR